MDDFILEQNRCAWDEASRKQCDASVPVSDETIRLAKEGDWAVCLTSKKPVPRSWFPCLDGLRVLCLASGGGQQAPILAAAGARVISLDLSEAQLDLDRRVAERNHLSIETVRGDMTDLSEFESESIDLIFNPTSNLFVPDLLPVWRGFHRLLRPGGISLVGCMNPSFFLFDHDEAKQTGELLVTFPLPYSDLSSLTDVQAENMRRERRTIEFGHVLDDLIGKQLECGFHLTRFYEDYWDDAATLLNVFSPTSFATRSIKQSC